MSKEIKGDIYARNARFKLDIERVFKMLLSSDRTAFYDSLIREIEIKYQLPQKTINEEIQRYIDAGQIEVFTEDNKKLIAVIEPWRMDTQELL